MKPAHLCSSNALNVRGSDSFLFESLVIALTLCAGSFVPNLKWIFNLQFMLWFGKTVELTAALVLPCICVPRIRNNLPHASPAYAISNWHYSPNYRQSSKHFARISFDRSFDMCLKIGNKNKNRNFAVVWKLKFIPSEIHLP